MDLNKRLQLHKMNDTCCYIHLPPKYSMNVWRAHGEPFGSDFNQADLFTIRFWYFVDDKERFFRKDFDLLTPLEVFKDIGLSIRGMLEADLWFKNVPREDLIRLIETIEGKDSAKPLTVSLDSSNCPDCHGTGFVKTEMYTRECAKTGYH